ncbi:MAG: hypothetical protein HN341_00790, partial [Verrucomicrobia bacterium]|nr:hypothetical protein [Verrucomicrobiota bacterium]
MGAPPADPGLAGPVIGEGLVRLWLYGDQCPDGLGQGLASSCPERVHDLFEHHLLSIRRSPFQGQWRHLGEVSESLDGTDQKIWQWTLGRVQAFHGCDGVVAVVGGCGEEEALAVPFVLAPGETRVGSVHDKSGREVGNWSRELSRFSEWVSPGGRCVVLSCDCGRHAGTLKGGSFALAVLLAGARAVSEMGDYEPLSVMCTGSVAAGGALEQVSGVPAKRTLARRMRVDLFVSPGAGESCGDCLALPPGTPVERCLEFIGHRLDDLGAIDLDPRRAYERIQDLSEEIHRALVPLERASTRVERYAKVFSTTPDAPYSAEGVVLVHLLRGAIANHSGDPGKGRSCLEKAAATATDQRTPLRYVDAVSHSVVSLTDLGLLDDAERTARELCRWVDNELMGSASDRLRCRMISRGVLGGQPLLQKGLLDPSIARESLALL